MAFAEGDLQRTYIAAGMKKENLGFIHMPAGPKRHVTLIGGGYYVFNKNATDEQIEAAFRYIDFAGSGRKFDETIKQNLIDEIKLRSEKGELIGVLNSSAWTEKDPKRAWEINLNTKSVEELKG